MILAVFMHFAKMLFEIPCSKSLFAHFVFSLLNYYRITRVKCFVAVFVYFERVSIRVRTTKDANNG